MFETRQQRRARERREGRGAIPISDSRWERVLQSTLFWACVGSALAFISTVIAAMLHDVRWLLIFAGVFGAFAIWEFARILLDGRGLIWAATTGVSFIWFFALSALYVALAPREGPTI